MRSFWISFMAGFIAALAATTFDVAPAASQSAGKPSTAGCGTAYRKEIGALDAEEEATILETVQMTPKAERAEVRSEMFKMLRSLSLKQRNFAALELQRCLETGYYRPADRR
tara:strand:- start:275 stop:610 length:336 start_codon:yes stop_codon:yes gene_type:complete